MANQVMLISGAVSHALAWIVYLVVTFGLVLWPAWQDGDGEDLRLLATVFAPVALTGLGLLTVLDQGRLADSKPVMIIYAVLLTLFCGLAILSIVLIHLPVSVKLTIGLIVGFYPVVLTLVAGRGGRSGWPVSVAMDYDGSALGVHRLGQPFSGNLLSAGSSGDVGRNGVEFVCRVVRADPAEVAAFAHLRSDANRLSETPVPPVQSRRTSSPVHRVPLCLRPTPPALRRRQSPGSHHPPSGAQIPAACRQPDFGKGRGGEQAEHAPSIDDLGRYGARLISAELPYQDDANYPEPCSESEFRILNHFADF